MRGKTILIFGLLLLAFVLVLVISEPALAGDSEAVYGILAKYHSPLPEWTIISFKESHPDFDIAGYLAVMWCESSLGKSGGSNRYNNPGNIKWGGFRQPDDPKVWLRWMSGKWYCPGQGWYGRYLSMYWGQRAAIRLIYDKGYNTLLAAHDWWGFALRYYGKSAPSSYVHRLAKVHDKMVALAAEYGATWEK